MPPPTHAVVPRPLPYSRAAGSTPLRPITYPASGCSTLPLTLSSSQLRCSSPAAPRLSAPDAPPSLRSTSSAAAASSASRLERAMHRGGAALGSPREAPPPPRSLVASAAPAPACTSAASVTLCAHTWNGRRTHCGRSLRACCAAVWTWLTFVLLCASVCFLALPWRARGARQRFAQQRLAVRVLHPAHEEKPLPLQHAAAAPAARRRRRLPPQRGPRHHLPAPRPSHLVEPDRSGCEREAMRKAFRSLRSFHAGRAASESMRCATLRHDGAAAVRASRKPPGRQMRACCEGRYDHIHPAVP